MAVAEDTAAFTGDGSGTYGRVTGFGVKLAGSKSAVDARNNTFANLTGTESVLGPAWAL
jgi:hypothetical protein